MSRHKLKPFLIKFLKAGFLTFAVLASFIFLSRAQAQVVPPPTGAGDEPIIVKFKSGVKEKDKDDRHAKRHAKRERNLKNIEAEVVRVPKDRFKNILAEYENDDDVEYAEPDYMAKAFSVTNDPSLSSQWDMFKIAAANSGGTSAWDISGGNSTAKIAVLDTGIDQNHGDLAGRVAVSQNFTTAATANDANGHGTHVAGVIAASGNNGVGIAGVAYYGSLMNVKVLDDTGAGNYSWVVNGITWAADNGAKVVNLSLGGPNYSRALEDAINYAWSKGVVVVAAAGNESTSRASYPAYYANVIAVAATDANDRKPSWSNYGSWVDVAAPGVNIYSTYKSNGYAALSGTSMAAPHVAGLAGLVWAKGDCTTSACVRSKIEAGADKIAGTGSYWAYGRINALNALGGTVTPAPTPTPIPTPTPTPVPTPTPIPTPAPNYSLSSTIKMSYSSYSYYWNSKYVYITIHAADKNGQAASGANVSLTVTTPSGRTASGAKLTNSNGDVTFSLYTSESGSFSAKINSIAKSGFTWDGLNGTASLAAR